MTTQSKTVGIIAVDTVLSDHAKEEIDVLLMRFPADQKKSAVLGALSVVQHGNEGFLTTELMDAVAEYLELAKIEVYEVVPSQVS